MIKIINKNFKHLSGEIVIPSDKSVSHRAVLFSALAKGKSTIKNFSMAKDPQSSLAVIKDLGIDIVQKGTDLEIVSQGYFCSPIKKLDCGNSGTTMRLMAGILSGQNFASILIGDESLSKRPMKRIVTPLMLMGANIETSNFTAPISINPARLNAINYKSPISSAQVKSCILLAGLNAQGRTVFEEPYLSRNHTEIMLKNMEADIFSNDNVTSISKSELRPIQTEIPGDISSAAFFIASATIIPDSDIIIKNIGLNPTRTGIIKVIKQMGGRIEILDRRNVFGEDIGDIKVCYSEDLKGITLSGDIIPNIIDEIPIISVLATQATGQTIIKDAQDLRNKESDRIKGIVTELKKLGANIQETEDGMIINGKTNLTGNVQVDSYCDHRIAMSLYVAGLISEKEISIKDFEWIDISFPEFEQLMENLK